MTTEPTDSPKHVLNLGCSCIGCCTIARFDQFCWGDEPWEVYLDFYCRDSRTYLWWRIKRAWKVLVGREEDWSHCLALDYAAVERLHSFTEGALNRMEEHGEGAA